MVSTGGSQSASGPRDINLAYRIWRTHGIKENFNQEELCDMAEMSRSPDESQFTTLTSGKSMPLFLLYDDQTRAVGNLGSCVP